MARADKNLFAYADLKFVSASPRNQGRRGDRSPEKEMPDVDLGNRHPALQSMCSKD